MKKYILIKTIFIFLLVAISCGDKTYAYWIWTPESKKFINPKYAVKDSPKEQFDWALRFYESKDYQKAASEFEKLTKHYEYSEFAAKSQYYVGLCYENMGKLYTAFQHYQKAVENFPHIENIDEIIEREFNIAELYMTKDNPRILGVDVLTSLDRAAEIYKKVVDNAPYGKLADTAQFRLGETLKMLERYGEAIEAFQKVIDDYQTSALVDRAKYEAAYCAYKASLKSAYDAMTTDKAIRAFETFAEENKDAELSLKADEIVGRLKDKNAEKSFSTARFYERQKHYDSAITYYQDVIDRFPESSFAGEAKIKIEELKAKMEI